VKTDRPSAARECAELLGQGLDLIEALADEHYAPHHAGADDAPGTASVGAHFRHAIDFFDCLLTDLDARRIDYSTRKRRVDVEHARLAGTREIRRALEGLDAVGALDEALPLEVRTEPEQAWARSTLARELHFVAGHTLHHYALVRLTLVGLCIEAPPEFGIAPSTLAHRASGDRGR
jgi:hypothetical protein